MATLLLNRGWINLIKNVVKPLYFYLYGKIDMKYEIGVSELTKFQLNPSKKIEKLDFDPQNKELQRTSDDVINFIIVLDRICDILSHYQIWFQLTFKQWK